MKKNITGCAFTNYLSLQCRAYSRDLLDNLGFASLWAGRGGRGVARENTLQSNFHEVCSARLGGGLGKNKQMAEAVLSSLHKVCTIVF